MATGGVFVSLLAGSGADWNILKVIPEGRGFLSLMK
jgi:hypothetical protein